MSDSDLRATNLNVDGLYVYPVKSLKGCALRSSTLGPGGLDHDRQWAIFKADGGMLTQREEPKMALIQVELIPDGLRLSISVDNAIKVKEAQLSDSVDNFKIWKDHCPGRRAAKEVGQWLSEVLQSKTSLSLAKIDSSQARQFNEPERFATQANYFSDAAPLLICNQASLDAVNEVLLHKALPPIDIRYFRPNIVISGINAFNEHDYESLTSGTQTLVTLVDHCQRCSVITVNPDTGSYLKKGYPLSTLMTLNTMPGASKAPAFGVNARVCKGGIGASVKVGQKLVLN